ncbi:hypothetical protein H0H92_007532 [Tricholoma furcatifolium]|nr:hypothetical protein H0H92_007532 [Tricholoma furcatifolium]
MRKSHVAHYLLALWSLGASVDIIHAAYKLEDAKQFPSYESPQAITRDNFEKFLGNQKSEPYRRFFTEAVQNKGLWAVLEEYIFDERVNFGDTGKGPEMLNRLFDGLVHPLIHVGYGVEFGLPGMVVEGLASTAIHKATGSAIIRRPGPLWSSAIAGARSATPQKNVHAFTILARILKDERFSDIENRADLSIYTRVIEQHSDALNDYVGQWTYDRHDPQELEHKIEELVWANVIIYGIGGWTKRRNFNADFFYMHLVTSSLFLSSLAVNLKPSSQELLLRCYFVVSLTWWIDRGRPPLDIDGFFAEDIIVPEPVLNSNMDFPRISSPASTEPTTALANPWIPILQAALTIPDNHVPKLHRALLHFAALYGTRAPGQADFANTELPGAELLDGSLFIRVAGLTNGRLLNPKEAADGKPESVSARFWDRLGFYKEAAKL